MSLKNSVFSCNFQFVIIFNITFKIITDVIPITPFYCSMSNPIIKILNFVFLFFGFLFCSLNVCFSLDQQSSHEQIGGQNASSYIAQTEGKFAQERGGITYSTSRDANRCCPSSEHGYPCSMWHCISSQPLVFQIKSCTKWLQTLWMSLEHGRFKPRMLRFLINHENR